MIQVFKNGGNTSVKIGSDNSHIWLCPSTSNDEVHYTVVGDGNFVGAEGKFLLDELLEGLGLTRVGVPDHYTNVDYLMYYIWKFYWVPSFNQEKANYKPEYADAEPYSFEEVREKVPILWDFIKRLATDLQKAGEL
jgi:hypothetical protein